LILSAFQQSISCPLHISRDWLEVNLDDRLPTALGLDVFAHVRVGKHDFAITERKSQAAPRRFVMLQKPVTNTTEFLEWDAVRVSEHRDGAQPNNVSKGVNAPKGAAAVLIQQLWGKEVRLVPVPKLALREAGEATDVVRGKGEDMGHGYILAYTI
jgi:hypothetical protein